MGSKTDITNRLERLKAFEERLGVRFEAISAFLSTPDDYDTEWSVEVKGELHPLQGTEIGGDLLLEISAYDAEGRVVEIGQTYVLQESFFGFETFGFRLSAPVGIAKLRLIPKVS